ncbi:cysteine--tRNA ligase [Chloroflexia bacterium SDU3-3]|nr:cysteine--tRNA ligase [Chloroflexia bacterium SDU3-3]
MSIQIYNTLSRKKEPFETIEPGVAKIYVCGVTVYDTAHIGHAMSAMIFDVVRRYLEYRGYAVQHVVNFTDVDDKIIARANTLGRDPKELAESYIDEFMEDLGNLNVQRATLYPRATETMQEIQDFISRLIDTGYAYEAGGDVYFRVAKDQGYGKLSGRNLGDMISGTRFDVDERKESAADFALWKAAKEGEPYWESPWGHGRPGWHIECSAMNLKHLGEQIDIHGGGNDLVFPHHENEIAQTESLTHKPFARFWMHNGMLQIQTPLPEGGFKMEKMSKSLGNVVTIRSFLDAHDADVLRLVVLSSYYRNPLAFGEVIVADQERKLARLLSALEPAVGSATDGPAAAQLAEVAGGATQRFTDVMDDDFNTSGALAVLFELVKAINTARDGGVGGEPFAQAQATLRELAGVLGLRLQPKAGKSQDSAPFIELLIELRAELRKAKQYQIADSIRQRLDALGVTLEDGPQGTRWKASR